MDNTKHILNYLMPIIDQVNPELHDFMQRYIEIYQTFPFLIGLSRSSQPSPAILVALFQGTVWVSWVRTRPAQCWVPQNGAEDPSLTNVKTLVALWFSSSPCAPSFRSHYTASGGLVHTLPSSPLAAYHMCLHNKTSNS